MTSALKIGDHAISAVILGMTQVKDTAQRTNCMALFISVLIVNFSGAERTQLIQGFRTALGNQEIKAPFMVMLFDGMAKAFPFVMAVLNNKVSDNDQKAFAIFEILEQAPAELIQAAAMGRAPPAQGAPTVIMPNLPAAAVQAAQEAAANKAIEGQKFSFTTLSEPIMINGPEVSTVTGPVTQNVQPQSGVTITLQNGSRLVQLPADQSDVTYQTTNLGRDEQGRITGRIHIEIKNGGTLITGGNGPNLAYVQECDFVVDGTTVKLVNNGTVVGTIECIRFNATEHFELTNNVKLITFNDAKISVCIGADPIVNVDGEQHMVQSVDYKHKTGDPTLMMFTFDRITVDRDSRREIGKTADGRAVVEMDIVKLNADGSYTVSEKARLFIEGTDRTLVDGRGEKVQPLARATEEQKQRAVNFGTGRAFQNLMRAADSVLRGHMDIGAFRDLANKISVPAEFAQAFNDFIDGIAGCRSTMLREGSIKTADIQAVYGKLNKELFIKNGAYLSLIPSQGRDGVKHIVFRIVDTITKFGSTTLVLESTDGNVTNMPGWYDPINLVTCVDKKSCAGTIVGMFFDALQLMSSDTPAERALGTAIFASIERTLTSNADKAAFKALKAYVERRLEQIKATSGAIDLAAEVDELNKMTDNGVASIFRKLITASVNSVAAHEGKHALFGDAISTINMPSFIKIIFSDLEQGAQFTAANELFSYLMGNSQGGMATLGADLKTAINAISGSIRLRSGGSQLDLVKSSPNSIAPRVLMAFLLAEAAGITRPGTTQKVTAEELAAAFANGDKEFVLGVLGSLSEQLGSMSHTEICTLSKNALGILLVSASSTPKAAERAEVVPYRETRPEQAGRTETGEQPAQSDGRAEKPSETVEIDLKKIWTPYAKAIIDRIANSFEKGGHASDRILSVGDID
ncbi:MAG: hypothetical protein PHT32_08375, partial [Candidatus Omnitrophica bacterium]|nr:hypothetical protein [Candidatus Omnitrophota bacterium]